MSDKLREYANGAYRCACGYLFLKDGDRWTCSTGRTFTEAETVEDHAPFERLLEPAEVVRRVAESKAEAEVEIDRVKTWGQKGWDQHNIQWRKREDLVSLMESWCDMGVLDRINGKYELSSAFELAVGAASEGNVSEISTGSEVRKVMTREQK